MPLTEQETREYAEAERERRRRERLRAFPSYGDWLPQASPAMSWHWRWQRYCQALYDRVTAGQLKRLMILAPPQHGKTEGGTVRYPVYRLEREPGLRIVIVANTQRLANTISRKARVVARGRIECAPDRNAIDDWGTEQGGGIRAVGIGGAIAGNPAELAFIDDPIRNRATARSETFREAQWEWYTGDFYTRVHEQGAIILQTTRWHEDDLAGRILNSEDGPNWTVVRLPALAEENDPLGREPGEALCPERYSREYLEQVRRIDPHNFESLYQGNPVPKAGGFFKRDWFLARFIGEIPSNALRIRWWDCAATENDGDWTVGVRMAKLKTGLIVIEDVVRGQWGPDKRDAIIRATAESDPRGTKFWREQEPGSSGKDAGYGFVKLLIGFTAKYEPSTGSKEDRADSYASQLAIGNVILKDGRWNRAFIEEHCSFPFGKHDDQVDAAAGGFNKLVKGQKIEVS